MTDAKKVRIGFVGVGKMGQCAHLRNYVTIPDCEVAAVAELQQDMVCQVAARYGIPKCYRSHEEMLANEALDALVASQPFTRHGILIPELLRAGIPVFTEKPLAGSIPVAQKITETVRRSDTFVMIGYHKRSDPATCCVREKIDAFKASGELGPMKYVRILMPAGDWVAGGFTGLIASNNPAPTLDSDPPPVDMDSALYETYLTFVNYYIHQVNLMRYLLGEPYSVTHADPSGVLLVGRSQSGVACSIEMSPYRTTVDWQESALVCFARGWIKLDLPAPLATHRPGRVEIFKDIGKGAVPEMTVPQLPWVHAMYAQALNFIRAVKHEAPPLTTAEEALQDLQVARDYVRLWKGR